MEMSGPEECVISGIGDTDNDQVFAHFMRFADHRKWIELHQIACSLTSVVNQLTAYLLKYVVVVSHVSQCI